MIEVVDYLVHSLLLPFIFNEVAVVIKASDLGAGLDCFLKFFD